MRNLFKKSLTLCLVAILAFSCFAGIVSAETAYTATIAVDNQTITPGTTSVDVVLDITSPQIGINEALIKVSSTVGSIDAEAILVKDAAGTAYTEEELKSLHYYVDYPHESTDLGSFFLSARTIDGVLGGVDSAFIKVVFTVDADIAVADYPVKIDVSGVKAASAAEDVIKFTYEEANISVVAPHVHNVVWTSDKAGNHTSSCDAEGCKDFEAVTEACADGDDEDLLCDKCGYDLTPAEPVLPMPTFAHSMSANIELKSIVYLNVKCTFEGIADMDPTLYQENVGLLVWHTDSVDEATATYENCSDIFTGASYIANESKFSIATAGIPAAELGDAMCFRAFYKNTDGSIAYSRIISNYSPKTYCYNRINKSTNAEEIAVNVALLNYGAAAQIHFNHNADNLMNSNLTDEQKNYTWNDGLVRSDYLIPAEKEGGLARTSNTIIPSRGGSVSLEGAVDYNYYSKIATVTPVSATIYYWTEEQYNSVDVLTLDNASSSEEMIYNVDKSRYEATYEEVPAAKMFELVYGCMVYTDAEGNQYYSGVIAYSPERFCYINKDKTGNDLTTANVAKTMVIYGDAARTYFN